MCEFKGAIVSIIADNHFYQYGEFGNLSRCIVSRLNDNSLILFDSALGRELTSHEGEVLVYEALKSMDFGINFEADRWESMAQEILKYLAFQHVTIRPDPNAEV